MSIPERKVTSEDLGIPTKQIELPLKFDLPKIDTPDEEETQPVVKTVTSDQILEEIKERQEEEHWANR